MALVLVYDILGDLKLNSRWMRHIFTGALVGLFGIVVIATAWEVSPGIFFDCRWVLISLCAFYFGWKATLIGAVMMMAFRLYQGGDGGMAGALSVVASALVGLAWRQWSRRQGKIMHWKWFLPMGVSVQAVALFCLMLLPAAISWPVIKTVFWPTMIFYPLATLMIGLVVKNRLSRYRSKKELQNSRLLLDREKGLLKGVIDSTPDLIFYKSLNDEYLGGNRAFEQFVGFPEVDIKGKSNLDLLGEKLAAEFAVHESEMFNRGKPMAEDYQVTLSDGREALFNTLVTPFYGPSGKLYGLVGISRDITGMHVSAEKLKKSEMTYRSVLATAMDGFWINSPDGYLLDVNDAYIKMSGYDREDLIGMHISLLNAESDRGQIAQRTERIIAGELPTYRTVHQRKDGTFYIVEINATYWEEGDRIFVFIRDITDQEQAKRRLIDSEARFRHVFEQAPKIAVQGYDKHRKAIFWNKASETLYGYRASEALGEKVEDLIVPASMRQQVIDEIEGWIDGAPVAKPGEVELQRADGSPVNVYSTHVVIVGIDGEPEFYSLDIDLTEQKKAEERVITLSQALEQSPVSVVLTDLRGVVEFVNATYETITGYGKQEVVGRTLRLLKSELSERHKYQELWATLEQGLPWEGDLRSAKKSGEVFWEYVSVAPVKNSQGKMTHYLVVKQDITEQKAQAERVLHQAHFDSLTQLPNRVLAMDRLKEMMKEAERGQYQLAVLFTDLDDFKKVNDTLGHQAGDEMLVDAAKRLRGAVRESDVVGRLGGDEFIIIINKLTDETAVSRVAEKLLESFRRPFILDGRELVSTISIGAAIYPVDGQTPSELLRQADAAMYHSKGEGRNTYNFYTNQMNADIAWRLAVEEQLRGALDREEFYLCYQPLVDLDDYKVVGAEALLRWDSKVLGSMPPDKFIPIAEQTGLIVPIGRYVLEAAVKQLACWRNEFGDEFHIAVNISPRQFRDQTFPDLIRSTLQQYQVPASALELEITEGVILDGRSDIADILEHLSDMGVSIAMDDFGTGYSSLSYLRSYPFNTVKVDRSFIHDITLDPADLELVSAAIAMGQGLGIKVIAEGIETQEQCTLLALLKCDYGQGYLFGKPVPADEFSCDLSALHP